MATTRSRRARSRWARRRSTPIPRRTRAARATTSTSDASRKGRAGGCRLSRPMLKAAGRMAVDLQRGGEAIPLLERALERASNDAEVQYLLGLAYAAEGREG